MARRRFEMKRLVIAIFTVSALSCVSVTYADNQKVANATCGASSIKVVGYKSEGIGYHKISLAVQNAARNLKLDFPGEFFDIACLKGKGNKPYIVFQNYCSGSGCKDLDNYGIIDPRTLKVLLMPDDTNRKRAAKILGVKPPPLSGFKEKFF
jgi:hypothetical protein